jgi:fatty-acyl-CoA synthase
MHGLMQDSPLSLPMLMDGMESRFGTKRVTTTYMDGTCTSTYRDLATRIRRLANVLDRLQVPEGARVGSFGWNSQNHLELYMAVPCSRRILHTINHRLFADDIAYIINDADDDVLFVDRSIVATVFPLLDGCPKVRHLVVMEDGSAATLPADPRILRYEELMLQATPASLPGVPDERTAAALCYTSGTTGRPKGVLYDHRSIVLHAMTLMMRDTSGLGEDDIIMPIVPMFHANAWGLPYAALMSGADLVLPGPVMAPENLAETMARYRVTFAAAVPTIWRGMLHCLAKHDFTAVRRLASGGGALPPALSRAFHESIGVPITSSWGMTEASPTICIARIHSQDRAGQSADAGLETLAIPGPPTMLCALRLVADDGTPMPHDGSARGELQVSGPTIASGYFGAAQDASTFTVDGWLRTGDVATIDRFGAVRIVDRSKDLIKSGGEWISSVELENEIMSMAGVSEAAVIGIPDPKWGERPMAYVVPAEGSTLLPEDIRSYLRDRIASWWIPESIQVRGQIPKTATGKISKTQLRQTVLLPEESDQQDLETHAR